VSLLEISAAVAALSLVVLVAAAIPLFLSLRAAAVRVALLADRVQGDLLPLLAQARQAGRAMEEFAPRMRAGMDGIGDLMQTVGILAAGIKGIFRGNRPV
jgi:hypothetical protein